MVDTQESGMQRVTRSIELANDAIKTARKAPSWCQKEHQISCLRALVDCLRLVSKSVFEHDDEGGYLTTTLFTFLLERPPTRPEFFLFPPDLYPNSAAAAEMDCDISEFYIRRLLGLLGLILLHDTGMSLPPLPRTSFYEKKPNNVAMLLCYLGITNLNLIVEGNVYDKLIIVMAFGAISPQPGGLKYFVEDGVAVDFAKILKQGPMILQAEVAHVISKFMAMDPTIQDQFPLHDLIGSLVSLLQVEVAEEHLHDDINQATSVLSIVAARHNSNKRKVVDARNEKSMSGEQNQLQQADSPRVKAKMRVMAAKVLGALAKDNAPACHIIVEKRAPLRFAVLLQNERSDVKLYSAMALMEITAVAEKEADFRRSAFNHSSHAHKTVVGQLMRIVREALSVKQSSSTPELVIPCIKAIGNLAATFRGTQPIISLVHHLLESSNYEVVRETLIALTKFACREHNFLHMDHSKAIVSLGGLNCILRLAGDEKTGLQKQALVLLCYVAMDALGNESDELKKVVSCINIASRKGNFSKDEATKALLQQTKRRLGQLMLA